MQKSHPFLCLFAAFTLFAACDTTKTTTKTAVKDDGQIDITFLQINDVYEISPLENGKIGGLARVATLRKQLLKENKNTTTILAGDFYSPSVLGTLKINGKRVGGQQMIETLNVMGLDLATFGNHEFDIKEEMVQERLNESKFLYISTNVRHKTKDGVMPFEGIEINEKGEKITKKSVDTHILTQTDADGTTLRVGVIGVTLPFNKAPFVVYEDVRAAYQRGYAALQPNCDFVVAITHLNAEDDLKLAKEFPQIQLLMGGHDHNHQIHKVGEVVVAKADANAKTAYIHRLHFDKKTKKLQINSQLRAMDATLALDNETDAVVQRWEDIGRKNFANLGFNVTDLVMNAKVPLDGREHTIRQQPALLLQLVTTAMLAASPTSQVAITNSGSVRVDDVLQGQITEFDVIRTLPFGGSLEEAEIKGRLLKKVLAIGTTKNVGIGGYLQFSGVDKRGDDFFINGKVIEDELMYKTVIGDFLLTGGEANLDFLKKDNPEIVNVKNYAADKNDLRRDVRAALIDFCRKQAKEKTTFPNVSDADLKRLDAIFR